MAKVTGPLMSVSASGKFAGTMVFASWKGRAYSRQLVTPANPKSAGQTGVRSLMKFLAQAWAALGASPKGSWAVLAALTNISNFNAFVADAMSNWNSFLAPTQTYPAARASTGLTITTLTTTGGSGETAVSITPSGSTSIWGYILLRSSAEITAPSRSQVVAVLPADGANAVTYTDSGLTAGTYHYRAVAFNVDGKMGTVKADQTATVS